MLCRCRPARFSQIKWVTAAIKLNGKVKVFTLEAVTGFVNGSFLLTDAGNGLLSVF